MRRLITVLRHHWMLVVGLTTVVVLAAWLVSSRSEPRYRASALLQVQTPLGTNGAVSLQDTLTARERAVTIASLGNSGVLWARAERSLTGIAPHECSFSQEGQSEFVRASCTGADRYALARAANVYATTLQSLLERQREQRVAELTKSFKAQLQALKAQGVPSSSWPTPQVYPGYRELEVIDAATTPKSPYAPRTTRTVALALVLGLLLNTALAFGLETLQNRARSVDDLARAIGEPVLGTIPGLGRRPGFRLSLLPPPAAPAAQRRRARTGRAA